MSNIRKTINTTQSFEVEIKIQQTDILRYIENSGATVTELNEIIRAINKELPDDAENVFKIKTLDDELKSKLLSRVFKTHSFTRAIRKHI